MDFVVVRLRKYEDRGGNVAYHLSRGSRLIILHFNAQQRKECRDNIVRAIVRARNQLKVVQPVQRLSNSEHAKEF